MASRMAASSAAVMRAAPALIAAWAAASAASISHWASSRRRSASFSWPDRRSISALSAASASMRAFASAKSSATLWRRRVRSRRSRSSSLNLSDSSRASASWARHASSCFFRLGNECVAAAARLVYVAMRASMAARAAAGLTSVPDPAVSRREVISPASPKPRSSSLVRANTVPYVSLSISSTMRAASSGLAWRPSTLRTRESSTVSPALTLPARAAFRFSKMSVPARSADAGL